MVLFWRAVQAEEKWSKHPEVILCGHIAGHVRCARYMRHCFPITICWLLTPHTSPVRR